ncbi:MAG: hypothetical protein M1817_000387 [Caeruleum heppii]|nr:MAG: hypothetical protein M1817_000387 [Caeruleum heppii]
MSIPRPMTTFKMPAMAKLSDTRTPGESAASRHENRFLQLTPAPQASVRAPSEPESSKSSSTNVLDEGARTVSSSNHKAAASIMVDASSIQSRQTSSTIDQQATGRRRILRLAPTKRDEVAMSDWTDDESPAN